MTPSPPASRYINAPQGEYRDPALRFAGWFAHLMDEVHIDPILGFILPGVGTFASSALGLSLVGIAIKRHMPAVVVARMLVNLALDAGLGAVPLLGNIFDWYFKANTRNLRLLEARTITCRTSPLDWLVLAGAAVAFCAAMAIPVVGLLYFVSWLRQTGS